MNVVSRIQFPGTTDVADLYMRCNEGAFINYDESYRQVNFVKGGTVSLNTYFNSFYEKFYAEYTELCSLFYLLRLEGDFQISVFREVYGRKKKELIYINILENCQKSNRYKVLLPFNLDIEDNGRVYLEIECLCDRGLFIEGAIATDQKKLREISLGIVTCTYKKETYVKKTIETILQDKFLQEKAFNIYIVDNGKTLSPNDFNNSKIHFISHRNLGGSGGFTRGLIEALQADRYTHFLLMDDDIELDTESIYKLISLYEYAKKDFAVAGSMLDLRKKHILYEAGALYGKAAEKTKLEPFSVVPLKHNLDLTNPHSLNNLLLEESIDYGGFWFFAFSKETIDRGGLIMPFFIKVDDMEFGLRITKQLMSQIIAFPSIAVWHEPFYAKDIGWDNYYTIRNFLITNSVYGSSGYVNVIKYMTKSVLRALFYFDYNFPQMTVRAFEDFMKGPTFFQNSDPERLHASILEFNKHYKSRERSPDCYPTEAFYQQPKYILLKKIVSLLTINGHLQPSFISRKNEAFVLFGSPNQWYKAFAKNKIVFFKEEDNNFYQNTIDKSTGIGILIKWLQLAITSSLKWSSVRAEWKKVATEFTSNDFWYQYLKLKN